MIKCPVAAYDTGQMQVTAEAKIQRSELTGGKKRS